VQYERSALTGGKDWQSLARGFEIGTRFHSAPVVRLADAMRMQLGHVIEAGMRWTVFVFSPQNDTAVRNLCDHLENDPQSPLCVYRRTGEDIDTLIDVRAVFQQDFRDLSFDSLPSLLRPRKGKYGLTDYEKAFCPDLKTGNDIFDMRGIDRNKGCMVVVRPDQHISQILPLDAYDELAALFAGLFCPANRE
jgi:phenol 2-monooxygenase (NADPH)